MRQKQRRDKGDVGAAGRESLHIISKGGCCQNGKKSILNLFTHPITIYSIITFFEVQWFSAEFFFLYTFPSLVKSNPLDLVYRNKAILWAEYWTQFILYIVWLDFIQYIVWNIFNMVGFNTVH